jgi:Fe-S cluster biogenesis protein NfuA
MFIQTENTPNPQALKFIPGQLVTGGDPIDCISIENATCSPLAEELFNIKEVKSIFLGYDFITVTKEAEASWEVIKPEILMTMMDFFVSGRHVLSEGHESTVNVIDEADPIIREIREIIETRVRPAVAQDGGDIIFKGFVEGIVQLELRGSCSGCPSSTITLKNGIESMLKHYVPEVIAVEAV